MRSHFAILAMIAGCATTPEPRPTAMPPVAMPIVAQRPTTIDATRACDDDRACLVNEHCRAGSCTARRECEDDHGCRGETVCRAGRCIPPAFPAPPAPCTWDAPRFSHADATLDDDARTNVRRAAECILARHGGRYRVVGWCDPSGSTEFNLALGERRARTVERFLVGLGVAQEALDVSSAGEGAQTATPERDWPRNRRVDIVPETSP